MKIIDIGICIDDNDPRGLGRVRCVRYSEYVSEKERSMEYLPYSAEDPFVVNPFLPNNINVIPKIGQSLKIINYDNEKLNVNQEYIAGPFINLININDQTFVQQIENTAYGNSNKTRSDVFDSEGNYRQKKSEGFYHKKDDYGIYGKNGSDLVFTNGGVVIRGGKLMSHNKLAPKEKLQSMDQPLMYNKLPPSFQIKKFPQKYTLEKQKSNGVSSESKQIKYVIEYDLDNVTTPTKVTCQIYKITNEKDKYNSNTFDRNTLIDPEDMKPIINGGYVKNVTSSKGASIEITNFIYKVYKGTDLSDVTNIDYVVDYPLYFRPTKKVVNSANLNTEFFNMVKFFNVGPMDGLIWSKNSITQNTKTVTQEVNVLVPDEEQDESISSLVSDRIFLLSTDPNESERNVDFNKVNNYEIQQETYVKNIEPETYSMVRGENLVRLLKSMVDVILTHEHNVVGPMVQNENYEKYTELMERLKNIENEVLNNKIKIN